MAEHEYKGWRITVRAKKVAGGDGWRLYPFFALTDVGDARRYKNLPFEDARVFPTEAAAEQAGIEHAKAWIDEQGREGRS